MEFNEKELMNLKAICIATFKIRKVRMRKDFLNTLCILWSGIDQTFTLKDKLALKKYIDKDVFVFNDGEYSFILEDNNYIITKDCYEEIS